ncbi:MAG: YidC/Oxa1 family membrane protein insertase [Lachnospiraceae bacterium]|nr:YidC/Oxa1 family membrane protein insertase [Lachnospiraceae bacterium]
MFLIKWIAEVLGILMNGIYHLLSAVGFANVGVAIILFTIIMYLLMTPLQIKQQRFTKVNAIMQPEIKKIQDKYQGKKDQASLQRQQEEMQGVYEKYGTSPTGSCGQMLIQLPILFALYQVIYKIPGYITQIRDVLGKVVDTTGFTEFFKTFVTSQENAMLTRNFAEGARANVIDSLYGLSTSQWSSLLSDGGASAFSTVLNEAHAYISKVTTFLGLPISDSPSTLFMQGWKARTFGLVAGAILIPVLAYLTQVWNTKLMPDQSAKKKEGEPTSNMEASMKSMNVMMPIMSAVFCFTLPVGIGIYWVAGAVVRGVQMLIINKQLDKEDINVYIEKARDKAAKKRAKRGLPPQKITNEASKSYRNLSYDKASSKTSGEKQDLWDHNASGSTTDTKQYKKGSIAARANMVRDFDERNRK